MMQACNDNRTKLYRIRRKSDGKFLGGKPSEYPGSYGWWDNTGCFWKRDETIRKHLLSLCKYCVFYGEPNIYPHGVSWYQCPIKTVAIFHKWLDLYEVVVTDITVHGENTMEACDFASFQNDIRRTA